MGTTNCNRRFGTTIGRRLVQTSFAVLVWLMTSPSLVYAHGMAAGEEVAQPLAISGALAFTCYWVVVLWPRSTLSERNVLKAESR